MVAWPLAWRFLAVNSRGPSNSWPCCENVGLMVHSLSVGLTMGISCVTGFLACVWKLRAQCVLGAVPMPSIWYMRMSTSEVSVTWQG